MAVGNSSFEAIIREIPGLTANADLSDAATHPGQYCFVSMAADLAVGLSSAGGQAIGVLQNKPASGQAASVAGRGSVTKIKLGGTVTAGQRVTAGSNGVAVVQASGTDVVNGIALQGGNSGDLGIIQVGSFGFATATP